MNIKETIMAIHTVYVTPTPVINGTVINKETATIAEVAASDTEMRVLPNDTVPNSADRPSIDTYLQRESGAGYSTKVVNNTIIITEA